MAKTFYRGVLAIFLGGITAACGPMPRETGDVNSFEEVGADSQDLKGGGKGGGIGKGHNGGTTTAVLTVDPNQLPVGSTSITASGSGFAANQELIINTSMFPQPRVTTDSAGSFSIVYSPEGGFTAPGPASVQAVRASDGTILATASYTVF